jgi:uncharacterized protein YndB with AHSA1/START domain
LKHAKIRRDCVALAETAIAVIYYCGMNRFVEIMIRFIGGKKLCIMSKITLCKVHFIPCIFLLMAIVLQPDANNVLKFKNCNMPNIRHELLIGSSAEKIYSAITNQQGLAAWWTPHTIAEPELNSVARFPFGPGYHKEMKIVELRPSELVKWNCIAGADEWMGTNISFSIQAGDKNSLLNSRPELQGQIEQQDDFDKGALLVFHHDDWKEYTPMFAECNYTWGQFLRSLKLFCETGKGRPWPNQHRTES